MTQAGTTAADVAALRDEIAEAFASRPYPGDAGIVDAKEGCQGYEGEETRSLLAGHTWQEVVEEESSYHQRLNECVFFLNVEGFAYYLPAFLTLALDFDDPHGLGDTLVFKLWSLPEDLASILAPAEKRVVVRFLETIAQEWDERNYTRNDARVALDHYWAYFTDAELGLA